MLHVGGLGSLWRVTGPGPAFPMVMKIPLLRPGENPLTIVGYEVEQMILPRLSGPHVPRFVAAGDFALPYIMTELIKGCWLKAGSMSCRCLSMRLPRSAAGSPRLSTTSMRSTSFTSDCRANELRTRGRGGPQPPPATPDRAQALGASAFDRRGQDHVSCARGGRSRRCAY